MIALCPKRSILKSRYQNGYFTSILPQRDNDPLLEVDFYRAFSDLRNFVARKVTKQQQTLWSKVTFNALIYMRFKDALASDALKTSIQEEETFVDVVARAHTPKNCSHSSSSWLLKVLSK